MQEEKEKPEIRVEAIARLLKLWYDSGARYCKVSQLHEKIQNSLGTTLEETKRYRGLIITSNLITCDNEGTITFNINEINKLLGIKNQCEWRCPECNQQCGGIENHGGAHQCPEHYKGD